MAIGPLSQYEETSFWARSYGEYQPSPPVAGAVSVDVAIIGGGFTGLSTAIEFKRDNPAATVAVLEGAVVGYGASGRNGGFSMTLFGLEPEFTKFRWGAEKTIAAHRYAQRAVAWVKKLIEENGLDSDYRHTGMFRFSYSQAQLKRLEHTFRFMQGLGLDDDLAFCRPYQLQAEFHTERFAGALYETLLPRQRHGIIRRLAACLHRHPPMPAEGFASGVRKELAAIAKNDPALFEKIVDFAVRTSTLPQYRVSAEHLLLVGRP